MDLLSLYNQFSLLTVAASLLAILGLHITTGSTSKQIRLIREFRTTVERANMNCLAARAKALQLEYDVTWCHGPDNVLSLPSTRTGARFVEEAERLIRTLGTITKDTGDLRVSQLRRRLRDLKRVDRDCLRLLSALETGLI